MSTFTNTAREVEMPNGDIVKLHDGVTPNSTSNIKKFKYDDNGHVTESTAADAEDLNLSGYSTPTTGTTDIGASDDVQTAIGKLDHQSHIDQTNILYSLQTGVKNILKPNATNSWSNMGFTAVRNGDGSITVSGTRTASGSTWIEIGSCTVSTGVYYLSGGTSAVQLCIADATGAKYNTDTDYTQLTTPIDAVMYIHIPNSTTSISGSVTIYPMICTKEAWVQEPNVYRPFALPNYDLTQLQSEDRNSIQHLVYNGGGRNILKLLDLSEIKLQCGTLNVSMSDDYILTVSGSDTSAHFANIARVTPSKTGDYTFSSVDGDINKCAAYIKIGDVYYWTYSGFTSKIPMVAGTSYTVILRYLADTTGTYNFKFMLREADISDTTYQPFALPNQYLTRMVNDLQKKAVKVYTYHVNPNESDPEDAVTYLDDATGLTPAKMGASSFSYGSWANAWFLPRPCMLKSDGTVAYYLNPNDYSKKTDGTASDIADSTFDGNVMLEFPKIWVKRVDDGNGARTVSIAPVNVDGTYKCWSNINAEDKEVDHFYLPAYNGTIHSSKMRSLSGVTLNTTYAPNYTRAQEVTAATANNPTGKNLWYTETWADFCLIYDLLYLMGKSLDVQRTFGQGLSSGAETAMRAYVTGTHNDKGLFYGDVSGTSTAVKVLGMENLWGCRWHGVAGLINDNGTLKVKMTYGVADGSTTVGYNTTGSGYLNYGSTYGTNGYVKKMQADNTMGYKIIETAGTDATYYCDYYYVNNSQSNYALLGGSSGHGADCGFYVHLHNGAADTGWYLGGSLSCRP